MKHYLLLLLTLSTSLFSISQESKKQEKQQSTNKEVKTTSSNNIDSTTALKNAVTQSCKCVESINTINKTSTDVAKEVADCIHKEVEVYSMLKLMIAANNKTSDRIVMLSRDKNSPSYTQHFREIEYALMKECDFMRSKLVQQNLENEKSFSKNHKAVMKYNEGVKLMELKEYEKAVHAFTEAVTIDSVFVFAWDNMGVCYRQLNKPDEAIKAYQKSLMIDPRGQSSLQNLAVAWRLKKEYEKSIEAYQNLLKYYPDSPEAYFGMGQIYKIAYQDNEKSLTNLCKAYNIYLKTGSSYRTDVETMMAVIYKHMELQNKTTRFFEILKEHKISLDTK